MFKDEDNGMDVHKLTESMPKVLSKFVQEVANKSSGRYPSRRPYSIVCGLKRFLVGKNGGGALSQLAVSEKRFHFN